MQVESIIMMKSLIHVSFIVFSKNKDVVLLIVEKKKKKKIQKKSQKTPTKPNQRHCYFLNKNKWI